tara:strand:- start:4600 stop:5484 length:885 start_codon:yes stop_codon:yes gene_type:complete
MDSNARKKWIHIQNATEEDFKKIKSFGVSKNDFTDSISNKERPRIATRNKYKLILVKIPSKGNQLTLTIGLILMDNLIITIHKKTCPVSNKLINSAENIEGSPQNLMLKFMQEINELFFKQAEDIELKISKIEDKMYRSGSKKTLRDLFDMRRELIYLNRSLAGNREVISNLQMHSSLFKFNKLEKVEIVELHNDISQLTDTITIYRELTSAAVEIYNSTLSNNMNLIMKKLTVVGALILIPTFITGLYGMNFNTTSPFNMPELTWQYGYFFSLVLMIFSVMATLTYFKIKKWI